MKILVTNNHYNEQGGSETWTYCLIYNLKKMHIDVDLYIFTKISRKSMLYKKTTESNIPIYIYDIPKKPYDLILANHTSTINKLLTYYDKRIIIQTCHGIYSYLEQPVIKLNKFVCVSKEIQDHLKRKNLSSELILNGIDCERFSPKNKINNELKTILSMVQDNRALSVIIDVCKELNINLIQHSKVHKQIFNIEDAINMSDLVITVGRGVYEALSCARNVITYDSRRYYTNRPMGYGLLTSNESINEGSKDNFTGRNNKLYMNRDDLKNEILKYDSKYGVMGRKYVLDNLNIKDNIEKYLAYSKV